MKASRTPYTPCKLFIDGAPTLAAGDYLRTRAGSAYLVQAVRQNRNRPQRRHLQCLRWPLKEVPPAATIHMLFWYPRKARAGRPLHQVNL